MRRTIISTVVAILGTGVVISRFAAALHHSVFFYTADGYMSPKTGAYGLMKDEEAPFSGGLAFRKTGGGGYEYREEMATAFIDRTSHTDINLATECERLGGWEFRK